MSTGGLGGLNKSPNGVVFGVLQLQLPNVVTPTDLAVQTQCIVDLVAKTGAQQNAKVARQRPSRRRQRS